MNLKSSTESNLRRRSHASSTKHIASGIHVRPFDLTPQTLKKRSQRSEGGQIVQELNSIQEGKYWDDADGGWLDPVLVRKAREEEIQYVKKHAVHEKSPGASAAKRRGRSPSRQAGRTNKGTSECPNVRSRRVAKECNWTQARLVQCNVTSGRSEARHLGSSVKQPERDSALGD